jgi:hypothetical protein
MPRKVNNAVDAAAKRGARRATLSVGPRELGDYVAAVSSEFGQLARGHDLRFLAYLLEMVCEEAVNQSRIAAQSPPSPEATAGPGDNIEAGTNDQKN